MDRYIESKPKVAAGVAEDETSSFTLGRLVIIYHHKRTR